MPFSKGSLETDLRRNSVWYGYYRLNPYVLLALHAVFSACSCHCHGCGGEGLPGRKTSSTNIQPRNHATPVTRLMDRVAVSSLTPYTFIIWRNIELNKACTFSYPPLFPVHLTLCIDVFLPDLVDWRGLWTLLISWLFLPQLHQRRELCPANGTMSRSHTNEDLVHVGSLFFLVDHG